jgi:hypothetical protein
MSAFYGPAQRSPAYARGTNEGAKAGLRAIKRADANERNAATPPERRRSHREGPPGERGSR